MCQPSQQIAVYNKYLISDPDSEDDTESNSDSEDVTDSDGDGVEPMRPVDGDCLKLDLTCDFQSLLDEDYHEIKQQGRLMKLSIEVSNVVQILEDYVKHCGFREIATWQRDNYEEFCGTVPLKSRSLSLSLAIPEIEAGHGIKLDYLPRATAANELSPNALVHIPPDELAPESLGKLYEKIRGLQFVVKEIRKLFDHYITICLLYDEERVLVDALKDKRIGFHHFTLNSKGYGMFKALPSIKQNSETDVKAKYGLKGKTKGRKREEKKQRFQKFIADYCSRLTQWSLIDDDCFISLSSTVERDSSEAKPSLSFGVIHLLRFFAWLPELLLKLSMTDANLVAVTHSANEIIEFIRVNNYAQQVEYIPAKAALDTLKDRTWRSRNSSI